MRQTSKPCRLLEARKEEIMFCGKCLYTENMQEKAEDNAERMFLWQNKYPI